MTRMHRIQRSLFRGIPFSARHQSSFPQDRKAAADHFDRCSNRQFLIGVLRSVSIQVREESIDMCVRGILNRGGLTQLETDRATIHNAPVAGMHFSLTIGNIAWQSGGG